MRPRSVLVALLALPACDVGEAPAGECDAPRRVLGPDEVDLAAAAIPSLAGDRLVIASGLPAEVVAVDACGGGPAAIAGEAQALSGAFALSSPAGPIALGQRPDGALLRLATLADDESDAPREIARLDPLASGWFRWSDGLLLWSGPLMHETPGPSAVLWYAGGADAATLLAPDVVWLARGGPDEFVALTEQAELLRLADGAATTVRAQIRRASLAPDGAQIAWQSLGGATSELHTLATDATVELAGTSAVRSARDFGTWLWTDAAVAATDASGHLISAHDRDGGTPLADPPPHLVARADAAPGGRWLFLTAELAPERVELAWDPHTGEAFEWYRGPDAPARPQADGDGVRYLDGDRLYLRRPGRARALLQLEASLDATPLADGRTLMSLPGAGLDRHRLVLLSADASTRTDLADGVARWSVTADDPPRVAYTIPDGPDAGVWVAPLE
jgi:hypothetical protein